MEYTVEQQASDLISRTAEATAKAVLEAAQAAAKVVEKENIEALLSIAKLETEVRLMKESHMLFEIEMNKRLDSFTPLFDKLFEKMDEVIAGRPTWAVTYLLGGLFSLCTGLVVFVLSTLM